MNGPDECGIFVGSHRSARAQNCQDWVNYKKTRWIFALSIGTITFQTTTSGCPALLWWVSRKHYAQLRLAAIMLAGLHKLWYPGIRDTSTWSKFGAHGEHGDVFLFSNLGALWFSENFIRYSLHVCLREVKNNPFSFKHSYLRHFSWRF